MPTAVLSQTVAFDDRGAPADPDEIDKKDKNNKRKLLEQERIAREQTKNSKRKS